MRNILRFILVSILDISVLLAFIYFVSGQSDKALIILVAIVIIFIILYLTRGKNRNDVLEEQLDETYFKKHQDSNHKIV